MASFAAGTLVHTKGGPVPIEKVKVGDLVLARPENGGEQAYRAVVQTYAHPSEQVIQVHYRFVGEENRYYMINTTPNHSFWVVDEGWTAAEDLTLHLKFDRRLALGDGRQVVAHGKERIYVSDQPGVGWLPSCQSDVEQHGYLWDFVNHRLVAAGVSALESIQNHELSDPFMKLPVYNLVVEDFHTYYVGEHGVWVQATH